MTTELLKPESDIPQGGIIFNDLKHTIKLSRDPKYCETDYDPQSLEIFDTIQELSSDPLSAILNSYQLGKLQGIKHGIDHQRTEEGKSPKWKDIAPTQENLDELLNTIRVHEDKMWDKDFDVDPAVLNDIYNMTHNITGTVITVYRVGKFQGLKQGISLQKKG